MRISEMVRCTFLYMENDYGHKLYRECEGERRYILEIPNKGFFFATDWINDKYDESNCMEQILVTNYDEVVDFDNNGGWL